MREVANDDFGKCMLVNLNHASLVELARYKMISENKVLSHI